MIRLSVTYFPLLTFLVGLLWLSELEPLMSWWSITSYLPRLAWTYLIGGQVCNRQSGLSTGRQHTPLWWDGECHLTKKIGRSPFRTLANLFSKTRNASICRINHFTWFETNDENFRISRSSIWHEKFSIASLSHLKIPRNILCKGISLISDSNRTDCPLVFGVDQPPGLLVFVRSMQIRENIGEHVCSISCEYHCFASTQRFLVPQLRIDSAVPVRCDDQFDNAILFWY